MKNVINIKGAREHNLKNIDLEIPRNKLVVITGLSGSGKSSLAFDTLYAEGQRRYVESLSSYARQFLGLMEKPDVDKIEGLSPAISIDQKSTSSNPRSTVGTVTEIYDYLRLLYANVGEVHCPECDKMVTSQTIPEIVSQILKEKNPSASSGQAIPKLLILSPIVRGEKGEQKQILEKIKKDGFVRIRLNGVVISLDDKIEIDKNKKNNIEIVVDRITLLAPSEGGDPKSDSLRVRLSDSVEVALRHSKGVVSIYNTDTKEEKIFSENFACPDCGISLPEISPRSFSFNSPQGACPKCTGLGRMLEVDAKLAIPNPRLTIAEGAIRPWARSSVSNTSWHVRILEAVGKKYGFNTNTPIEKLKPGMLDIIMNGTGDEQYNLKYRTASGRIAEYPVTYEGVIKNMQRRYKETDSDIARREIEKFMREKVCDLCHGKRLKKEILGVKVADRSIDMVVEDNVEGLIFFFQNLPNKLGEKHKEIAKNIIKEINARLRFLVDVGLGYITIDRSAYTLSGGEAQRIRLATQIGSGLTGVLYILDEPTIGLHQRDTKKLIKTLEDLRDLDNTLIVVEHDEQVMMAADHLIDIGPGAGEHGGRVISQGTPEQVKKDKNSLTGKYLSGKLEIETPNKRRKGSGKFLEIIGATENNLKNIDVKIPLGEFVCVTGVSGSGKSSLVNDILAKRLSVEYHGSLQEPGKCKEIKGVSHLDKVINIDQSAIGRSPRSNPATYTGLFTTVREIFSSTKEAKARGYGEGRFSFNVKGGRCEACRGDGVNKIEMHFLPDVYVTCDVCHGKRYTQEVLDIYYKDKNIADVLDLTIEDALKFFENIPLLKTKLEVLNKVGLGYMKLGQSATTLSGGEAQRVKLATELSRRATGKTLYILDEPTTGLHFDDTKRLLAVLQALVDKGNSILVIEHNLDVIKCSDWIIDLGPEGGNKGGEIVAEGTPEAVAKNKKSYTGEYLKKIL
ncbi:MAG: excinuclease ABC subunit UvrA [Patescibacteria group bacterium]|nr:excinuclease ABC subunit UvrA [Patescibacteria group bacterium]